MLELCELMRAAASINEQSEKQANAVKLIQPLETNEML